MSLGAAARAPSVRAGRGRRRLPLYLVLGLLLLGVLFPFYWIVVTSVKTMAQIQSLQNLALPNPFTWENYRELFGQTYYGAWFRNSALVACGAGLLAIGISALAAYAIARLRFPGRTFLASAVLVTYLVPPSLLFIPLYVLLNGMGLANSLWALVAAYPTFTVPFATWLLMGFLKSIPGELEDAALVDGANRLQAFRRVILPLAAPGIVAAALFSFTLAWNEFLYALIFVQDVEKKTIPVGLSELMFGDIFLWGQLMAASIGATVPVILLYIYLHRYMVQGLTAGAVKG
jgi:multiple sugar transport system permease protein